MTEIFLNADGDFEPDAKALIIGKLLEFLAKRTIPVRYCDIVKLFAYEHQVPEDPLGAIIMDAAVVLLRAGLIDGNDNIDGGIAFGSDTYLFATSKVIDFTFEGYLWEAAE